MAHPAECRQDAARASRHRGWHRVAAHAKATAHWFFRLAIPTVVTAVLSLGLAVVVPSWVAAPIHSELLVGTRTRPVTDAHPGPPDPGASWSPARSIAGGTSAAPLDTAVLDNLNWSGYAVGGGPFTSVTGSFNVPGLAASSIPTYATEWVGFDGTKTTTLIQAGVAEMYDSHTNLVYTEAWWEILPDDIPMVLIPVLPIRPGDNVTVMIWQVRGTLWGIALTDDTTGQTFITDQTYRGARGSAEWIVEDPVPCSTCWPDELGEYSPEVAFSGLQVHGPETTLTTETLSQGSGGTLSMPSALTTAGFSVAYVATVPPMPLPPFGSGRGMN